MRGILILTILIGTACTGRGSSGRPRAGWISVSWTGTLRDRFSAPATARWCAVDTLLEVIAVRNDTSFGFSLAARDSVRPELYVVNATRDFTPGRPQAGVGLRLLGETTLLGFDGMGGQVGVTRGVSPVSGTIDVRMQRVGTSDSLRLRGSFERIPVTQAVGLCGRANKPGGR